MMAEPHVVTALREKRAELSGRIADLEKRISQDRADLHHVDAVLRLFAPDLDPVAIRPKAVRQRNPWFRPGELARMVLDLLRVAPTPLSVREITTAVMQRHGLDPQDGRTAQRLRKLVHNALNRQAADVVERLEEGLSVTWRVRD